MRLAGTMKHGCQAVIGAKGGNTNYWLGQFSLFGAYFFYYCLHFLATKYQINENDYDNWRRVISNGTFIYLIKIKSKQ